MGILKIPTAGEYKKASLRKRQKLFLDFLVSEGKTDENTQARYVKEIKGERSIDFADLTEGCNFFSCKSTEDFEKKFDEIKKCELWNKKYKDHPAGHALKKHGKFLLFISKQKNEIALSKGSTFVCPNCHTIIHSKMK